MKTRMQTSSLEAYSKIKKLGHKELQVLGVILRYGAVSNQEIADLLEWPVNRVTGRTFELREKGFVTEAYRDVYNGNVRVIHWKAVPVPAHVIPVQKTSRFRFPFFRTANAH